MEGFNVKIKLETLTCHNKTEKWGKAVPYLWTIFFRIDGDSVIIAHDFKLVGKGVFQYGKGSHGNLNISSIEKGQTVSIPKDVGEWTTYMKPFLIPYFDQKVPSMIGAISILMEQNNVSGKGAEAGHKALNQQVELAVNQSLAAFNPKDVDINDVMGSIKNYFEAKVAGFTDSIEGDIKKAIKKKQSLLRNLWTLVNVDNMLGHHVWNFNQKDILESEAQSIDFGNRWQTGEHGDWEIKGNLSIIDDKIPQKESLEEPETKALNHTEAFIEKAENISESNDDDEILEMSNLAP
jgi:hypothetical protein